MILGLEQTKMSRWHICYGCEIKVWSHDLQIQYTTDSWQHIVEPHPRVSFSQTIFKVVL